MINVLVTGGNGQLGKSLNEITKSRNNLNIVYTDFLDLDITSLIDIQKFFSHSKGAFDYCINCAAYTAVDKAEDEEEKAYQINALGPKNLAKICKEYDTTLIHASTDFVFDGKNTIPYNEEDIPNPLSIYGKTKLDGERFIQAIYQKHIIIRTSWLYSPFGENFVKTMLKLGKTRSSLNVVDDQFGSPTNALDLADTMLKIIDVFSETGKVSENLYGIYHFSNQGVCSWYDFAKEIFKINNIKIELNPIPSSSYLTPAKRPPYSVLDKNKIIQTFNVTINQWKDSLKNTKITL